MANTTQSANMNMPIPNVGVAPGPEYATDINNSLTIVDAHNHSPGSGVQVTPDGLNINSALTFNNNLALSLAGITFTAQSTTPSNATLYESGVDLYFVDGNGNNVRITQSGSVAGSTGNIAGLTAPAAATYSPSTSTFIWQSNSSTPKAANMDAGSLLLRNLTPNSTFALTLKAPANLASNYSVTLPAVPGVNSFLGIDTTGNLSAFAAISAGLTSSNLSASANITGSQLSASAGILGSQLSSSANITGSQLAAGANIVGTQLANATLTHTQISNSSNINKTQIIAVGQITTASSGTFSHAGTTPTTVTNLALNITTSGKPVIIMLQGDGSSTNNNSIAFTPNLSSSFGVISIIRVSTAITNCVLTSNNTSTIQIPPGGLLYMDPVAAGTYSYSVQVKANDAASSVAVINCVLTAYEMV